jgi:predicted nucleic acid-binding protein
MIVVDSNFLILLLAPDAMPHIDAGRSRVEFFIEELGKRKEEIVIPAPVIAEIAAGRIDRIEEIVETLLRNRAFSIHPFDQVTAIEAGYLIKRARDRIPEAQRLPGWKVAMKYDAMIAATARVRRATAICTDDDGLAQHVQGTEITVLKITDLPYRPENPQKSFPYD